MGVAKTVPSKPNGGFGLGDFFRSEPCTDVASLWGLGHISLTVIVSVLATPSEIPTVHKFLEWAVGL